MIEFQRPKPLPELLNLTSLIDVIFLLLLFFILTSIFADPGIPVELSESAAAEFQQTPNEIRISLLANGNIGLNGATISMNELPSALESLFAAAPRRVVAVDADQDAPFERFIRIIDLVKSVGGEKLLISTEVAR
ncbi:biopolymer transport protein ExbD/TolR [Candidatus Moduliflexus flocculans]|uniref:Biopolymer transport protein ExbD/TolR n=1 Tax=Candidatus Moduliflexus flocculans TaxID=1499966 RepID=A0A081BME2_9BACT|nr:biopolymer transport protein ExbD/TolR [Candidatus Moduliflexus flocculans]